MVGSNDLKFRAHVAAGWKMSSCKWLKLKLPLLTARANWYVVDLGAYAVGTTVRLALLWINLSQFFSRDRSAIARPQPNFIGN